MKIYDIFYLYKYSSFSVNFHPEINLLWGKMFNTEKPQFTTYLWLFKKNIFFEINGEQVQENWIKNKKKIESRNWKFQKMQPFFILSSFWHYFGTRYSRTALTWTNKLCLLVFFPILCNLRSEITIYLAIWSCRETFNMSNYLTKDFSRTLQYSVRLSETLG